MSWVTILWSMLIVSLVGFVRLRLRAGRPWLAWTVCVLRRLARLLDPYASFFFVATGITPAMFVVVNSRMNLESAGMNL
jgi:hypothetical protein